MILLGAISLSSSTFSFVSPVKGQVIEGWQVAGGSGNYSEANGVITLSGNDTVPGTTLYRDISPQTDFEISLQVKAATLGEVDRDPNCAGEGFAMVLRQNASMFGTLVGINFEFRARGGGQFLVNRHDNLCNIYGWSDDWTPFVYDSLGYNDGYAFWHPSTPQNLTGAPFPPSFQLTSQYNTTNAPVRANVLYTMKLQVQQTPFIITAEVLEENGSLLGSYSVSDMDNFAFKDIGCIGISNGFGGTFYVTNVTGIPPISTFDYSPSQPSAYSDTIFNASNSNPQDQIVNYSWTFGDGTNISTTQPLVSHVYQSSGQFNVTLVVTDSSGYSASTSRLIQVLLPTSLSISTAANSTAVGSSVNISGQLLNYDGNGIPNVPVVVFYTFAGADSWYPLSSAFTDQTGDYNIQWLNTVSGTFTIKAQWTGNQTYSGVTATTTLSALPYQSQNVFFVESNSTLSSLSFNSTNAELSFTASGPPDTTGYAKVTIAKSLIQNTQNIKVTLDGNQINYTLSQATDSWLLTFSYHHSTHSLNVFLPIADKTAPQVSASNSEQTTPIANEQSGNGYQFWMEIIIVAAIATITILTATVARKKRNPQ